VIYDPGYSADEISSVPQESADMALGCGNPTAMANLKAGETVLDIGSGGGMDAFLAARQVAPNGRVIGVDMTHAMLEKARQAAARAGLDDRVEFRFGKADALPVGDDSVDVILSNCVINLCEDKGRVFEEAYRVLKPGGRLEVNDMVSEGALPNDLKEDPANWSGCIFGALPQGEYIDLVKEAGFKEVLVHRSTSSGRIFDVNVYSLQVSAKK